MAGERAACSGEGGDGGAKYRTYCTVRTLSEREALSATGAERFGKRAFWCMYSGTELGRESVSTGKVDS